MTHLQIIASEHKTEVRIHVIQLCVSSYPDVRPWQVRKACSGDKETQQDLALAELYYQYLCLLLHPFEGSESAKQDRELVKVSVLSVFRTFYVCRFSFCPSRNGVSCLLSRCEKLRIILVYCQNHWPAEKISIELRNEVPQIIGCIIVILSCCWMLAGKAMNMILFSI